MGGFALMATLYLQLFRGCSALHAGLLFLHAADRQAYRRGQGSQALGADGGP